MANESATFSGRCSSCHGQGVWVSDGGGVDPEGRIGRCRQCDDWGKCQHCHGLGCSKCDRDEPPRASGDEEVVFSGFLDGGDFGQDDRFTVKRVRAGYLYGLVIESSYNAGGRRRVVLPAKYHRLEVVDQGSHWFEVEADEQILLVRHVRVVSVRDPELFKWPEPTPVAPASTPRSTAAPSSTRRQRAAARSSTPRRPAAPAGAARVATCARCHQPRGSELTCPHCAYTDWLAIVLGWLLGLSLILAAVFWAPSIESAGLRWCVRWLGGGVGAIFLASMAWAAWIGLCARGRDSRQDHTSS